MQYELYIDRFFFTNFMLDLLLLCAVRRFLQNHTPWWRVLSGAVWGALCACFLVVLKMPFWWKILLFYTVGTFLLILAGLQIHTVGEFLCALASFYLSAFLLGGVVYAFFPYVPKVLFLIFLAVVAYMSFTVFLGSLQKAFHYRRHICTVRLVAGEQTYTTNALVDTGNMLTDPVSGDPVSMIDRKVAGRLLGQAGEQVSFRYIPFCAVNGENVLPVFRMERMCIHLQKAYWVEGPLLGVCQHPVFARKNYEMILNPAIFWRQKKHDENSQGKAV